MKETWIVVYLGSQEWDEYEGTLNEVIERATINNRHFDYGHKGLRIYPAILKYEIKMGPIEWRA